MHASTTPDIGTSTAPRPARVAVLGLGAMGSAIARALLAAGHPTTVWNRTTARAEQLAAHGADVAPDPAAAIADSDLAVVCVLDAVATRAILEDARPGVRGRTIVNASSTTPDEARSLASWAVDAGGTMLDTAVMVPTPMVGTDAGVVLVSGDPAAAAVHLPTLAALGGSVEHVGAEPGTASALDLAMLDLYFTGMTGMLHATTLAQAEGIEPGAFLPYARSIVEVLSGSLDDLVRDAEAGSYPGVDDNLAMELSALDHVVHASERAGLDPRVPGLSRDLVRRAVDAGHGADSFSRVIELMSAPPSGRQSGA